MKRREVVLGGLLTTAGLGAGLTAYSHHEADSLSVETRKIAIQGLQSPLKIAQLSDIHWDGGASVGWSLIERAVDRINAESVDLVALTGDFVTRPPEPIFALAPLLGRIKARHGLFAVLGNHDNALAHSRRTVAGALRKAQVEVLENRWTAVAGLAIAGTGDFWFGPFEPEQIFTSVRAKRPTLLLSHNPDAFWPMGERRIDLQLSGHTHGGQVRLPVIGPILPWLGRTRQVLKRYLPEFAEALPGSGAIIRSGSWGGHYQQGGNQLYVSRGLGRFRKLSIGCPPELTFIDLLPA